MGETFACPNKFRKRKRFASKPFKFASFVSPPPKKVCFAILFGDPPLQNRAKRNGCGCPAIHICAANISLCEAQYHCEAISLAAGEYHCVKVPFTLTVSYPKWINEYYLKKAKKQIALLTFNKKINIICVNISNSGLNTLNARPQRGIPLFCLPNADKKTD